MALRIFILSLVLTCSVHGQQFDYHIRFEGFADNREYFNDYTDHQTIFGSRLSADVGIRVDSIHQFRGGLSQMYEFGGKHSIRYPDITLYYTIDHTLYDFYIGAFPRHDLVKHPLVLLTDTLQYFRPNLEGAFLEFNGDWGYQHFWIDWLSRQTNRQNEIFLAGYSGLIKAGDLFLDHHFIMHHIAPKAVPDHDFHLRDNGGLTAQPGYNFASWISWIKLDTLSFAPGVTMSYDRQRGLDDEIKFQTGFLANVEMAYKGYGVSGRYYLGGGQTQVIGDRMYSAKRYIRVDTYITPMKSEHVRGKFTFSVHILPDVVDFSQQFLLVVDIHEPFRKRNIKTPN